jgi:hypothetical protein
LCVGDITDITTDPFQSSAALPYYAFGGCASLTDVSFSSSSITSSEIPAFAFYNCTNLENITFANVTTANFTSGIGNNAFVNCANLKNIIFPKVANTDNVAAQVIDSTSFYGCATGGHIVFSDTS